MPGTETRLDRSKYLSLDEHLEEFLVNNKRLGRGWCPLIAWLRDQPNDSLADVIAAEVHMQSHPEWGPSYCCDVIRDTWRFNPPQAVEEIQHDHALALVRHDWTNARLAVEALLSHDEIGWQSREALRLIVEYFAANHPNPKAFLAQSKVRVRLPVWLNISELPCPDVPELAGQPMTGLGVALPV